MLRFLLALAVLGAGYLCLRWSADRCLLYEATCSGFIRGHGCDLDPWGQPWVADLSRGVWCSAGPNGRDEGGRGDDIPSAVVYRLSACQLALVGWYRSGPEILALLVLSSMVVARSRRWCLGVDGRMHVHSLVLLSFAPWGLAGFLVQSKIVPLAEHYVLLVSRDDQAFAWIRSGRIGLAIGVFGMIVSFLGVTFRTPVKSERSIDPGTPN